MIALALLGALAAGPASAGKSYTDSVHLVSFPGAIGDSKVDGHAGWFTAAEIIFPSNGQPVTEGTSTSNVKQHDESERKSPITTITLPPSEAAERLGQQLTKSKAEHINHIMIDTLSDGKLVRSVTLREAMLNSAENTKAGVKLTFTSISIVWSK